MSNIRSALSMMCLSCIMAISCTSPKKVVYFNGLGNDEFVGSDISLEPTIQKNDLLSISVSSLNPEATEIFNVSNVSATQASTATGIQSQASGYLVDQDGFIYFPILGKIKAAGMTKKALKEYITSELTNRKYLLNPNVDIRYLNYKVSVLGEVARPSVFTIPNEKITLLEALGLAGDMTIYGKRKNVLLIRETDGVRKTIRIDLTSSELFTSPYYYLQSNDIIYVEPGKSKIASTNRAVQWLPVIISSLSMGIIALDRFY